MEPKMLKVTITGETREYPKGISYADIVKDFEGTTEAPIILVTVDGKLRELHKRLKKDCTLTFIYSLDGERFDMVRLFHLPVEKTVKVGIEAQSPAGDGGLRFYSEISLENRTVRNLRAGV